MAESLAHRVDRLLEEEHAELIRACAEFDRALTEREASDRAHMGAQRGMFDDRPVEPLPDAVDVMALRAAWNSLREPLERLTLLLRTQVLRLAAELGRGSYVSEQLRRDLVTEARSSHGLVGQRVVVFRDRLNFVPELRPAGRGVLGAIGRHRDAEEREIYPALLEGERTVRAAPQASADGLVRQLRGGSGPRLQRIDVSPSLLDLVRSLLR